MKPNTGEKIEYTFDVPDVLYLKKDPECKQGVVIRNEKAPTRQIAG